MMGIIWRRNKDSSRRWYYRKGVGGKELQFSPGGDDGGKDLPVKETSAKVAVEVELPRDVVGDVDASQLSVELRRLWAVEQVRRRRLGVGKAAEVAGMPRAVFMQLLGEHEVPVIDYAVEDLQEELRSLSSR